MTRYFIAFAVMFITFRVNSNPDYGFDNGAIIIQLTEKPAERMSNVGLKIFDFEI